MRKKCELVIFVIILLLLGFGLGLLINPPTLKAQCAIYAVDYNMDGKNCSLDYASNCVFVTPCWLI